MPAPTSLCPGFRHVEEFDPSEEYESGEEVSYVTFDLGNIEPTLVPSSSTYRLIGLDTPTPYLQLSGTILKGRHDSLLGTELLFTDEKEPRDRDQRSVAYTGSAEQRVTFKEVRLHPKESAEGQARSIRQAEGNNQMLHAGSSMEAKTAGPSAKSKRSTIEGLKPRKRAKGKAKATIYQDKNNEEVPENAMDTSAG